MPGKDGKVSTTGNIKEVMKESVTVAEMLMKSRAAQYGIDYEQLKLRSCHQSLQDEPADSSLTSFRLYLKVSDNVSYLYWTPSLHKASLLDYNRCYECYRYNPIG